MIFKGTRTQRRKSVKNFLIAILLLTTVTVSFALETQPIDVLKTPINRVISILKDPQYHDAAKKDEQREKMWEIIQSVFDFKEISRRTLARNWKHFGPEQQKQFIHVFSEFLGDNYLNRIQSEYKNQRVIYKSQKMLSGNKALIRTKILRENDIEIPVDYKMKARNHVWKIYDVNIEGVSLVNNYRSQFARILLKETPEQLIKRLKIKLARQKKNQERKRKE